MELTADSRKAQSKSEIKKIRREGNIPAVLYSQGKKGETLVVSGPEFRKILQNIEPGTLPTTRFTLKIGGKKVGAILKDIQYAVTSYQVIHLDFEELHAKVPVTLNIPITCVGVLDCIGVKLGGNLRLVARTVKVRTLPENIPTSFDIDVRDLNVGDSRKFSDLAIPKEIKPLIDLNGIAVIVAKR